MRERKQDIPLLVRHFVERFSARENAAPCTLSTAADQYLKTYHWPGNVRELENSINRAMVMDEDNILDLDDFSKVLNVETTATQNTDSSKTNPFLDHNGVFKTIDTIEHDVMRAALQHFDGNTTQAAKAIGMAKSTFYRKMKNV